VSPGPDIYVRARRQHALVYMTSFVGKARALVGGLLADHPEARSLLSEASHWRGLAAHSAALAAAASQAADLARLRYEELRHRLDPRGHRRGQYGVACFLVASIGLALAGLAWIELAPWIDVTGRPTGWLVATAVAAIWLFGAWLAASPSHPRRALLAVAAAALTALLSGLVGTLPVVLLAVLSALLALFAAVLIARAEPVTLARGHRHWRRATRHRDAAVATAQSDAESAAVTRESWLGLVRAATAAEDEQVAREAIAVAASMIEPDQMGYRIGSGS
jgi:hypothetical protein